MNMESVFTERNHFIMWATVQILATLELKTDSNALENAVGHAQKAADYFFGPAPQTANPGKNPFNTPPAIRQPPRVSSVGPQVPGQKPNPNQEPVGNVEG
jgi:hypothetical protein